MNSEVPELPGASVAAETEPGSVQPPYAQGEIAIEEAAPASTPAEEPAANARSIGASGWSKFTCGAASSRTRA